MPQYLMTLDPECSQNPVISLWLMLLWAPYLWAMSDHSIHLFFWHLSAEKFKFFSHEAVFVNTLEIQGLDYYNKKTFI